MDTELKSYKPYARFITIVSAIIIFIASLDATQVINIFPEYASQINSILVLCGVLAPALAQELRVVRAEDLIKEDYNNQCDCEEIIVDLNPSDEIIEEIVGGDGGA